MNLDASFNLLSKAKEIGTLSSGYVWIVINWLSFILDSNMFATNDLKSLQGAINLQ